MNTPERQTYTVEEAAQVLGIGRKQAYEHARAGLLPVIRVGRRILIPKARLAAWLAGDAA